MRVQGKGLRSRGKLGKQDRGRRKAAEGGVEWAGKAERVQGTGLRNRGQLGKQTGSWGRLGAPGKDLARR